MYSNYLSSFSADLSLLRLALLIYFIDKFEIGVLGPPVILSVEKLNFRETDLIGV